MTRLSVPLVNSQRGSKLDKPNIMKYTVSEENRSKPMNGTIKNRHDATSWQKEHDDRAPKVGDLAPDFELCDSDGQNLVRLSDFRGQKPVALVFGSFT